MHGLQPQHALQPDLHAPRISEVREQRVHSTGVRYFARHDCQHACACPESNQNHDVCCAAVEPG